MDVYLRWLGQTRVDLIWLMSCFFVELCGQTCAFLYSIARLFCCFFIRALLGYLSLISVDALFHCCNQIV